MEYANVVNAFVMISIEFLGLFANYNSIISLLRVELFNHLSNGFAVICKKGKLNYDEAGSVTRC